MKKTLIALSLTIASAAAMADGFYVGGDVGSSTHSSTLASGTEVGGFAGYEWNKNVATELGYEQYPGLKGPNGSSVGHAHALKLDMDLTQYVNNAQTFGLVEFVGINQSGASGAGTGFGYDYGVGLRYNVSSNIETRLRFGVTKFGSSNGAGYNFNDGNIDVGVAYHF